MAQRDDITIDWYLSPRIIRVAFPSTELTVQDNHDTNTEIESRPENLIYNNIISTAGKQDLGGGVLVGLSSTLLDAKIAFDARKISVSNGNVTTDDLTGKILTDASADFIADGVEPGASIFNITDESVASVIQVINSTQLLTDFLEDGYDNQFEIGDRYKVWNTEQCNISGGNIVAVDGYGDPISPVLPTFGTQIVRTASSSATLQEQLDIQQNSYNNGVLVDVVNGVSGTNFPTGTTRQPVNNLADALTIAKFRGLDNIFVRGDLVVDSGLDFRNFRFVAHNTQASVTIASAALVDGCEFVDLEISGVLDGYVHIHNCVIFDVNYVDGLISDSNIQGTITLSGTNFVNIINCYDGIAGFGMPTIDCGGGGTPMNIRGYRGGLLITNNSTFNDISIDMDSARIILDSTITDGNIIVRGVGLLTNNSTATVDDSNVVNPGTTSNAALKKILPFIPE